MVFDALNPNRLSTQLPLQKAYLRLRRCLPSCQHWPNIHNHFAMARPNKLDGFWASNSSSSWVASWTEPVILWCASCSCTNSTVSGSIHGISQHLLLEVAVF